MKEEKRPFLLKKRKKGDNDKRNSSIELLRLILMTLIVFHHISINTNSLSSINIQNYKNINKWKYIFLKIISNYGQFGNNTFIMISGCFSASKTSFNIDKFLSFLFEIYTYYYPSIFIGKILKNKYKYINFPNFRNKTIYMPNLTYNGNWFAQIYLTLILFFPYINTGLINLDKRKYKNLVIITIIFYCIFNKIIKYYQIHSIIFDTTPLINLLIPYIIGGYFHLYNLEYKTFWTIIGLIYFPLTILLEIILDMAYFHYNDYFFILLKGNLFYDMDSIISILGSIGIIYIFKNITFYSKIINWISFSIFGIYLFHGNKNISPYIYNVVFKTNDINEQYFFLKYFIKALLIVAVSLFIDIIRRYTIGSFIMQIIKKIKLFLF